MKTFWTTRAIGAAIAAAIMLPGLAAAQDADLIDGYRTNDFVRFLPEGDDAPANYRMNTSKSNPAQHMVTAEYEAGDGSSFANIRIFGWPMDNPVAVPADGGSVIGQSLAGIRQNIADEGWPDPEEFQVETDDGAAISCLRTQQTAKAEFVFCVTPLKGRVMEVQHLASVEAHDKDQREKIARGFVAALTDHVTAAD